MAGFLKRNAKALTALAGAAIAWGVLVLTSDPAGITGAEVASGLIGAGTALGVYRVPNVG